MSNGEQTGGWQYCWNVENMGPDYVSDRATKNASIYTEDRLNETL